MLCKMIPGTGRFGRCCSMFIAAVAALVATTATAQVRISQVYIQGGVSGSGAFDFDNAPYYADFIELYNAGGSPVDLSTYSLQWTSVTGATWTQFVNLTGTIPANGYYLVQLTDPLSGAGGPYPVAPDDARLGTTASQLISGGGKVALVSNQTLLPGQACPDFVSNGIVDFVGITGGTGGTAANCSEGSPVLQTTTNGTSSPRFSVFRKCGGSTDTNNNLNDFEARHVYPRNSASPPFPGIDVTVNLSTSNEGPCFPTSTGFQSVVRGVSSLLITVSRTTCSGDPSTGGTVTVDLTELGGPAAQPMFDDNTNGDVTAGDNIYSYDFDVPANAPLGIGRTIIATVSDAQGRTQTGVTRILVENSAPVNDLCAGAIEITSVPFVDDGINNRFATDDGQPSCLSGSNLVRKGVWYKYTPSENGYAVVSETGSQNVAIAAYTGSDCNNLTSMTAAQMGCYTASSTNLRPIPMNAGTTYWILVGTVSTLSTTCPTAIMTFEFDFVTAPANDLCANAIDLNAQTLPFNATIQNIAAGDDSPVSCAPVANGGVGKRGVWFKYTPATTGVLTMTEADGQAAMHTVYSGTCLSLVEEFCTTTDTNQGTVLAGGTTYYILLSSDATSAPTTATPFDYTVNFAPLAAPPNDTICTATDVSGGGNFVVDNRAAENDTEFTLCLGSGSISTKLGVWYKYVASSDCVLKVVESSSQDIAITAYTGAVCSGVSYLTCTTSDSTIIQVINGETYWFLIGHPNNTFTFPTQDLNVTFTCGQPPVNDTACGAITLTPGVAQLVDNSFALPDVDVGCNNSSALSVWHGVWYTYTPGANCSAGLSEGSTQNVVMAVFSGSDCFNMVEYFCTDVESGENVDLIAGQQYWFLVGINSASSPVVPTVNASLTVTCNAPAPADACISAAVIASLPFSTTINNNAFLHNAPQGECDQLFSTVSPHSAMRNDVWHRYTATETCTGLIFLDPPGPTPTYDGLVQVFQGADCQSKTLVGCSDWKSASGEPEYLNFPMQAGQTYWIQFGRAGSGSGGGGDTFFSLDCAPPPPNDFPCNATVLTGLPVTDFVDISAATHDVHMDDGPQAGTDVNFCGTVEPTATFYGVWYTYTPTTDCTIVIEDTGAVDVNLGIFTGTCDNLTQIECTGFDTTFEIITAGLDAGTQYWFLIGAYAISTQPDPIVIPLSLSFDCRSAPANDLPCGATDLNVTGLPFFDSVDVAAATHDIDMTGSCNAPGATLSSNGVWYKYAPATNCTLLVDEGSTQNAAIAVYSGPCDSVFETICTGNESLSFGLTGGQEYWILVALGTANPGMNSQTPLLVTIDCSSPPLNDAACGATVITATPFSDSQSITLATDDFDTLCNASGGNQVTQKGVWWTYTPTQDCIAQINETSSLNTSIAVFEGGDCNFVFESGCSSADHFGFYMIANQQYWILIGLEATTPSVPTAQLAMTFDCVSITPPANDEPCGATEIASLPFTDTPTNAGALDDVDVTCNNENATVVSYGVWYRHTPAAACTLYMSDTSLQNVVWAIFTGTDCLSLNQQFCSTTDSGANFPLSAGVQYWILVGNDWSSATAPPQPGIPLQLAFDCATVPANDTCPTATMVTSIPYSASYNNILAVDGQPIGSCNSTSATDTDNDVWFSWTAPTTCTVEVNLADPLPEFAYGQICTVYAGSDCNSLVEVACAFSSGVTHQFPFFLNAVAGETYWFQNGRRALASGAEGGPTLFTITGECEAACATCPADTNGDSTLDGRDVQNFTECLLLSLGGPPATGCDCANVVIDSVIDTQDIDQFVARMLSPPSCP